MHCIQDEWQNLLRMTKMIAAQFGPRCEVVLHDLTRDYNHTIVTIENGHVTGRVVGGSGSNLGLPVLSAQQETEGDRYNYFSQTKDGRTLRSSTTYFRNPEGQIVGSLCINYDLSDLTQVENTLRDILMYPAAENGPEEIFADNVGEILDHLTTQCREYIGRCGQEMSKEEKIRAIEFFDSKGAFLISKAGEHIRRFLNISKYTLYNYLEISRSKGAAEAPEKAPAGRKYGRSRL